jgi:predicted Zn-dependent protease with MMP-like domain
MWLDAAAKAYSMHLMNLPDLTALAAEVVDSTIAALPDEIRHLTEKVPVHYQSQPDEAVQAEGLDSDILGLFTGQPYGTEYQTNNPAPPQIILYLDNIWSWTGREIAAFQGEVNLTYLHELGHYFGWDEEDLAARGLD